VRGCENRWKKTSANALVGGGEGRLKISEENRPGAENRRGALASDGVNKKVVRGTH